MTEDFSSETMEARRKWLNIFWVVTEKNCQPEILYPVKIFFRNEEKIEPLSDQAQLKELVSKTKEWLKQVLLKDRKRLQKNAWNFRKKKIKYIKIEEYLVDNSNSHDSCKPRLKVEAKLIT